jgi:D-glycero-D-manno-heptose 1,7-bisphosphate phosphatase
MSPNRAVFLDRDGTLNEEVGYLCRIEDLVLIQGAGRAVGRLNRCGYKTVVVTNQSGVARGFFDEAFVGAVHQEISRRMGEGGGRVDGWYYCPHHPTEGLGPYRVACNCRKPSPGMIDQASRELGILIAESFVVGDSLRDIDLALNVGAMPILVLTGYGNETLSRLAPEQKARLAYIAPDLPGACKWICEYSW